MTVGPARAVGAGDARFVDAGSAAGRVVLRAVGSGDR
jgi:hypothetical protein